MKDRLSLAIGSLEDRDQRLVVQLATGINPIDTYFDVGQIARIIGKTELEVRCLAEAAITEITGSTFCSCAYELRKASSGVL